MRKFILIAALFFAVPAHAQTIFRSLPNAGAYNPATQTLVTVQTTGNDVRTRISSLPPNGSASGDLGSTYPSPTVLNISNVPASVIGSSVFTNTVCSAVPAICASFFGYFNPKWYGATGSDSGDDEPAIASASAAACASGLRVKFTPGTYQKQRQFDASCSGLVWFADPQNTAYDGDNEHAAVIIHDNTGFFTSANNCGYNQNGFVDQVIDGINFHGDGGQQGTVLGCNSHNTSGGDQIPRIYFRNGSSSGYGATVGCSLKLTGVTGAPQCFTGTGTTQNNLMTARFENWKFTQNALGVGGGNITDLKIDKNSEIAGNACGAIDATLDGTEGIYMGAFRTEENGVTGFSGICGAASPTIEVTGPYWNIDTQFQNNNGVALLFDHSCGADGITGGYSGDGIAGATGAESEVAFNASCAGTISFNGFIGSVVGAFGQVAPKYFAQNTGTNVVSFIGGNLDSTQYTTARDLITAGSLTYDKLLTLGQVPIPAGGASTTPADNAVCTPGNVWWDASFGYLCTTSGTVKRWALSTF